MAEQSRAEEMRRPPSLVNYLLLVSVCMSVCACIFLFGSLSFLSSRCEYFFRLSLSLSLSH